MRKRRSPVWSIPSDKFKDLVLKSTTIREVLDYFGLENGSYKTIKHRCLEEHLPFERFTGNLRKGGFNKVTAQPLDQVMVVNSTYSRTCLKKRLIKDGFLPHMCSICGLQPVWQEQKLVLVLDHINGINNDNRLSNLRLLCPNCNSQTSTFAGRTQRKRRNCKLCGKLLLQSGRLNCVECRKLTRKSQRGVPRLSQRKVTRPSSDELAVLLWVKPTRQIAKDFGVSDKAVEKWAKFYGIPKPPRGYWGRVV